MKNNIQKKNKKSSSEINFLLLEEDNPQNSNNKQNVSNKALIKSIGPVNNFELLKIRLKKIYTEIFAVVSSFFKK